MGTESIAAYLRRKLKQAGKDRWQSIADAVGCNFHTLRKFVHSDRDRLDLTIVDPLLTLFKEEEAQAEQAAEGSHGQRALADHPGASNVFAERQNQTVRELRGAVGEPDRRKFERDGSANTREPRRG